MAYESLRASSDCDSAGQLYSGSAMLLESAFMRDSGLQVRRLPPRLTSLQSESGPGSSDDTKTERTVLQPVQEGVQKGSPTPESADAKHGWGRGWWNILHSATDVNAPVTPIDAETKDSSSARASLQIARHNTADSTLHTRRGSDGLPRSLTRSDSTASRRKPKGRVARLFNAFSKGPSAKESVVAEEATDVALDGAVTEDRQEETVAEVIRRTAPARLRWKRPILTSLRTSAMSTSPYIRLPTAEPSEDVPSAFADQFILQQHFGLLVETPSGVDILGARQYNVIPGLEASPYTMGSVSSRSVSARSVASNASAKTNTTLPEPKREIKVVGLGSRHRDMVRFYSKQGSLKDVSLGEVLEEIALSAGVVASQENRAKPSLTPVQSSPQHVALNYINGGCLVTIATKILPAAFKDMSQKSGREDAADPRKDVGKEDADVETVAAILHADREQAREVLLAAETAVQAAAGETGDTTGSKKGIHMWLASAGQGEQSLMRPLSEVSSLGLPAAAPN